MCPASQINTLKDKHGVLHHTPSKIKEILQDLYRDLYTQDNSEGGASERWLENSSLSTLTDEERGILGDPITKDELERAITYLKFQKTPGPDGYTANCF